MTQHAEYCEMCGTELVPCSEPMQQHSDSEIVRRLALMNHDDPVSLDILLEIGGLSETMAEVARRNSISETSVSRRVNKLCTEFPTLSRILKPR